ncbi:MAG TPA: hypothetical protein VF866_03705, partial [Xanthobacteraceae bacterium]
MAIVVLPEPPFSFPTTITCGAFCTAIGASCSMSAPQALNAISDLPVPLRTDLFCARNFLREENVTDRRESTFRDYPLTGHDANVAESTRMTQLRHQYSVFVALRETNSVEDCARAQAICRR